MDAFYIINGFCIIDDFCNITMLTQVIAMCSVLNNTLNFAHDMVNFSNNVTDYNNFVFDYTNYMYDKYPEFHKPYTMVNQTLEDMRKYTENITKYTQNIIRSPTDEQQYIDDADNYIKLIENSFKMTSLYVNVIRNYIKQHIYPRNDNTSSLLFDLSYTIVMQDAIYEMTLKSKQIENSYLMANSCDQENQNNMKEWNENTTMRNMLHTVCLFEVTIEFILFIVGLPVICLAGYALFHLVRATNLVPVIFVINLLVSHLINLLARIVNFLPDQSFISTTQKYYFVYFFVFTSIFFMMCISLERYLVIVHPLWYKRHRSIKNSLIVTAAVWVTAAILVLVFESTLPVVVMMYIIPFPFLAFFMVGAWRGLTAAISVSDQDKRKIMGTLKLMLATYAILYLPYICMLMYKNMTSNKDVKTAKIVEATLYWSFLSGLVQPFQYVFLRSGAIETQGLFPCCGMLQAKLRDWKISTGSSQTETTTTPADNTVNTVSGILVNMSNVPHSV